MSEDKCRLCNGSIGDIAFEYEGYDKLGKYLICEQCEEQMSAEADEPIESNIGPKCPYCGHVHEDQDDLSDVCTYWGETTTNYDCRVCGLEFPVEEIVTRSWKSKKVERSPPRFPPQKSVGKSVGT